MPASPQNRACARTGGGWSGRLDSIAIVEPVERRGAVPDELVVYGASDCCLCEEATAVLRELAPELGLTLRYVPIDGGATLEHAYREQIPVGFLGRRKIFKFREPSMGFEPHLRLAPRSRRSEGDGGMIRRRRSSGCARLPAVRPRRLVPLDPLATADWRGNGREIEVRAEGPIGVGVTVSFNSR